MKEEIKNAINLTPKIVNIKTKSAISSSKRIPSGKKKKFHKNNSLIWIHSSYTKLNNVNMVNLDPKEKYTTDIPPIVDPEGYKQFIDKRKRDELWRVNDKLQNELLNLGSRIKSVLENYKKREEIFLKQKKG